MTDHHSTVEDRRLPHHVAEQFEIALDLARRPETLGEWVDITANRLDRAGVSLGVDEMCLTDTSPHRAETGDETRYFACVLDTLLLPFVLERSAPVEIRTRSPVSDCSIDAEITEEDVTVQPASAVMSFGLARDPAPTADRGGVIADGTASFCPYVNVFLDEREYEEWAQDTPEAVTVPLPLEEGFALASALGHELTADPA